MRILVLAAFLLAGCTASPDQTPDPAPEPLRYEVIAWDDVTYTHTCALPPLDPCPVTNGETPEPRELNDVGLDLWINLTWTFTSTETEFLDMFVHQGNGDSIWVRGQSPLYVHVDRPISTHYTVEVRPLPYDPLGMTPSGWVQAYHVIASYARNSDIH